MHACMQPISHNYTFRLNYFIYHNIQYVHNISKYSNETLTTTKHKYKQNKSITMKYIAIYKFRLMCMHRLADNNACVYL